MQRRPPSVISAVIILSACSADSSAVNSEPGAPAVNSEPAEVSPRTQTFSEDLEFQTPEYMRVTVTVATEIRVVDAGKLESIGGERWYEMTVRPSVRRETMQVMAKIPVNQLENTRDESAAAILSALDTSMSELAVKPVGVRITKLVLPKAYLDSIRALKETKRENERQKQELERQIKAEQERVRKAEEERRRNTAPR